jgi:AmiR/NasT family two-component response regulator
VIDPDTDGDALIRGLQRTQARISHVWPAPASFPVDVDIVISELLDDLPARMPWTPGDFPVALCLVVREQTRLNMTALRDSTPHGTLSLPLRRNDIAVGLTVALEQFHYERRLRARIDKLDDYIRAIRSVERAKSVIMARKQVDENEAYHYLRRQAMARRISIGELALAIVDTDQLLS